MATNFFDFFDTVFSGICSKCYPSILWYIIKGEQLHREFFNFCKFLEIFLDMLNVLAPGQTQHNNSDSPSTKWNRRSVLVTCAAILITGFQNKFFQMWCSGPSAPRVVKRPSIYKKFSGICHDIDKFWHPNSSFSHKLAYVTVVTWQRPISVLSGLWPVTAKQFEYIYLS